MKINKIDLLLAAGLFGLAAIIIYIIFFSENLIIRLKEQEIFIKNPYQGRYVQIDIDEIEKIEKKREYYSEHDLLMYTMNLNGFQNSKIISEEKINKLIQGFEYAKKARLSVIFRAAYDFDDEYQEPDFDCMISHIEQIGKILNSYKDCIAGVQAGMIGAYGEWHSSVYMDKAEDYAKVAEAWLENLEEEIPVSVRRQEFIRQIEKQGVDISRIGIYNDGLFASESDLGTYRGEGNIRQSELEWTKNHILVPFNGGEMPKISEFTEFNNVLKEADDLQISYLNRYYNKDIWEIWKKDHYQGIAQDQYLRNHLGYCPWIEEVSLNRNFHLSPLIRMKVTIANTGFSVPYPDMRIAVLISYNGEIRDLNTSFDRLTKERVVITAQGFWPFWESLSDTVKIGLKITRGEDDIPGYEIQLLNEEIIFEDGVNWISGDALK